MARPRRPPPRPLDVAPSRSHVPLSMAGRYRQSGIGLRRAPVNRGVPDQFHQVGASTSAALPRPPSSEEEPASGRVLRRRRDPPPASTPQGVHTRSRPASSRLAGNRSGAQAPRPRGPTNMQSTPGSPRRTRGAARAQQERERRAAAAARISRMLDDSSHSESDSDSSDIEILEYIDARQRRQHPAARVNDIRAWLIDDGDDEEENSTAQPEQRARILHEFMRRAGALPQAYFPFHIVHADNEQRDSAKEARIAKAKAALDIDNEPAALAKKYSRGCKVCLSNPNPLVRVVLKECGHTMCAPCVDQLEERVGADKVRCPFCRKISGYVKLFEEEDEEAVVG